MYLDELVLRRVRRAQQADGRRNGPDMSDVESDQDSEADTSVVAQKANLVKKERGRPRRVAEDVEDDD
jgi:hypothetical protein